MRFIRKFLLTLQTEVSTKLTIQLILEFYFEKRSLNYQGLYKKRNYTFRYQFCGLNLIVINSPEPLITS